MAAMTDDCVFESTSPPIGDRIVGHDAVRAFWARFFAASPSSRFDAEEDAIVFRRLGGRENWLAVLKECPVSPDDVPPRRRELPKRRKL